MKQYFKILFLTTLFLSVNCFAQIVPNSIVPGRGVVTDGSTIVGNGTAQDPLIATGGGSGGGSPMIGGPVIDADPFSILYTDEDGNLAQDVNFTRNDQSQIYATNIGGLTNASAEYSDPNGGPELDLVAITPGDAGSTINLTFNGTDTAQTVVDAWNTANPSNQVAIVNGTDPNQIPVAGSAPFIGGGSTGLIVNARDFMDTPAPFPYGTGSVLIYEDPTRGVNAFNGVTSNLGDPLNSLGAFMGASVPGSGATASSLVAALNDGAGTQLLIDSTDALTYEDVTVFSSAGIYSQVTASGGGNSSASQLTSDQFNILDGNTSNEVFHAVPSTLRASMGDVFDNVNGTVLGVDDSSGTVYAQMPDNGVYQLQNTSGAEFFNLAVNGGKPLINYGSLQGTGNGNTYTFDDDNEVASYFLGKSFTVNDKAGNAVLDVSLNNFSAELGDINSAGNNTLITVDDQDAEIFFQADDGYRFTDVAGNLFMNIAEAGNNVRFGGGIINFNTFVNADYTITTNDYNVNVFTNNTAGATTLTIGSPANILGATASQTYTVSDYNGKADSFPITIVPGTMGDTINGMASYTISRQFGSVTFHSNGDHDWVITSQTNLSPVINSSVNLSAQTTAVTVASFTPSTTLGTYRIGGYLTTVTLSADVLNVVVSYTDENNNPQTKTLLSGASSVGAFTFPDIQIRALSSAPVVVSTTITGAGSQVYDVGASIETMR